VRFAVRRDPRWGGAGDHHGRSDGNELPEPQVELYAEALDAYLANPRMLALRGANARQFVERCFSRDGHLAALRRAISKASAEARYLQSA
jgi:hypothetical protein